MQPENVQRSGLDRAEAEQDGTALIGHAEPTHTETGTIGQDWHRISDRLVHLFSSGVAQNDPLAQEAIQDHYRWLCNFWTPDRDSYVRLAKLYVSQPQFRKRIERKKPDGLATYMRDAMITFAWARLS